MSLKKNMRERFFSWKIDFHREHKEILRFGFSHKWYKIIQKIMEEWKNLNLLGHLPNNRQQVYQEGMLSQKKDLQLRVFQVFRKCFLEEPKNWNSQKKIGNSNFISRVPRKLLISWEISNKSTWTWINSQVFH